jgi:hypothetical protein
MTARISTQTMAKFYGVSAKLIRQLADRGVIPSIKIPLAQPGKNKRGHGFMYRFDFAAVVAALEKKTETFEKIAAAIGNIETFKPEISPA